jgi:hypothetical protein
MRNNSTAAGTIEKQWAKTIQRHRTAIAGYLQTASRIDEQVWRLPVKAEKWTPAQITEHLILTYQITLKQIRGGQGIKPHYNFLLRPILRLVVLPGIFRERQLPGGAKAPQEIMPEDSKMPRETALKQLKDLSVEFETEILSRRSDEKLRLTHHVFGQIKPLKGVDLRKVKSKIVISKARRATDSF